MSKISSPSAIRLSVTNEVRRALILAKNRYPTLSDSEILKLGLSKIVTEDAGYRQDEDEIRNAAASAVGRDYLADQEEDVYTPAMGKKVHYS
jgi:hypothetical protein